MFFVISCTEQRQLSLLQEAEEMSAQGNYVEAINILKRTVRLKSYSRSATRAIYRIGYIYENFIKDFEQASKNYKEFLEVSVDPVLNYEVRKRLANLYFENGNDPMLAIENYKKLLKENPKTLEADEFQLKIAEAFYRQNAFDQARIEYRKLIDNYPKSQYKIKARFELATSYYMEGSYEIALETYRQIMRNFPQSEYSLESEFYMAQCLENLERIPAAIEVYQKLAPRYPSKAIVEMRIAEAKKKVKGAK